MRAGPWDLICCIAMWVIPLATLAVLHLAEHRRRLDASPQSRR